MVASGLHAALAPKSVAIVGASDNPHKVGGRPILYMQRYGFKGPIYPINPARATVQGYKAFPNLDALPEAPELVIVAVSGDETLRAVEACAARGVRVAVVMASGFGELGESGKSVQQAMVSAARGAGMRLIGPNCQGLANFATGVVANFSTIFNEMEAKDGPVAIVSQSGATSQAIYALARQKGLGVRHVHATGNEADVTIADLAREVVRDEDVGLLLLYMEAIHDPAALAEAAQAARARELPIVAVKAGRTASGQKAASSHTGALASEDHVVDAFLEKHAIWRVPDPHGLVAAAELYLAKRRPQGKRLVFISNSGASCVMAADLAEQRGIPLAPFSDKARAALAKVLPGFATVSNPIDVTGALLGNSQLFGAVLPILGEDRQSELVLLGMPVAGTGYDVPGFARDLAGFADRYGHAVAVAAPQAEVRAEFSKAGVATFSRERDAMEALVQLAEHVALLRRKPARVVEAATLPGLPPGAGRFMNEAESLALLAAAGIPVTPHRLCKTEDEVRAAFELLSGPVAVKACSRDAPHKSELGLVALGVASAESAAAEFRRQRDRLVSIGASVEGILIAKMAERGRELALGARVDPQFGPVVLVGAGGIYLEALKDFALLLPPFGEDEVLAALARLHIAPLLAGVRGEPPRDLGAVASMAVRLGEVILGWRGKVASIDINPVVVFETGRGAVAVDALLERELGG
jgi:acetate---CoA ligase (ADP-forming)